MNITAGDFTSERNGGKNNVIINNNKRCRIPSLETRCLLFCFRFDFSCVEEAFSWTFAVSDVEEGGTVSLPYHDQSCWVKWRISTKWICLRNGIVSNMNDVIHGWISAKVSHCKFGLVAPGNTNRSTTISFSSSIFFLSAFALSPPWSRTTHFELLW